MSVVSVKAKDFILALFIRDDGERFLLGDNGFDFADSQMHFAANTIENDEVAKQGTDGVMVAGQVRRSSVQSFDGYVGDGTTPKETIEQMRRAFIAYFAKGHHFRVVYVDTARNAWQRKGGYLVDAPEVKELYQIHPEYHVGLNFEDVNYYSYDENADGDEILANLVDVPISSDVEGGLEWDSDGAISEDATIEIDGETATETGKNISVNDSVDAPISSFQLDGETSQQTYSGKNLLTTAGIEATTKNGVTLTYDANTQTITLNGTCGTDNTVFSLITGNNITINGTYTLSYYVVGGTINPTGATRIQLFDPNWGNSFLKLLEQTTGSVTETRNTTLANGGIRVDSGSVFNNYKFKIQFEKNSSRTDWEPFVGRTAAPNPSYPQAVQTVTGENVVKICGKNLFDKDSYDSLNAYVNGTIITTSANNEIVWIPCEPDTDYAVAAVGSNVSTNIYSAPNIPVVGGTANWLGTIAAGDTTGVFTTKPDAKYIVVRIWTNTASQTLQEALDALQIELGNQATAYEAYQGQSYEINLGKNLLNISGLNATDNGVSNTLNSDGSITCSGTVGGNWNGWNLSGFMAIDLPTGTYTFSIDHALTVNIGFVVKDSNNSNIASVSINAGSTSVTFTIASAGKSAMLWASANTGTAINFTIKVQTEKGSQATSYAAYFEPIELCKIGAYQDYIYKSGDKWYVHKEVGKVDLSACTWFTVIQPGILKGTTSITDIKYVSSNQQIGDAVAEKYLIRKGSGMSAASLAGYFAIDVEMVSVNTGDSSVTPTGYMYYALATPTDTEITNQALVAQLEAILSQARTYAGTTNITTVIATGNEQGTLEVEYYTSYKQVISGGGYVWEDGGSGGATTIINNSISAVSPVWTVHGSVTNPTLENVTTGETIEYVGTIGAGQTLTVDMGEQTASLDGLNVIGNIVGDFISLAPGGNTLLYSATGDAPDSEIGWSEIVG